MRTPGGRTLASTGGFGLLEALIAIGLVTVAVAGLLAAFTLGVSQTQGQGEMATRTTDYCQDKMEQLLALDFNDGSTNTTVYPASPTGGTGLGGTMAASTTVGGINAASPVASYVDYLDVSGNLLANATSAFYTRQWSIATDSTAKMKTITVLTTALTAGGGRGAPPSTRLVCIKTLLQ